MEDLIKDVRASKKFIGREILKERVKRPFIKDNWISRKTGLQSYQLRKIESGDGLYSLDSVLKYAFCLEIDIKLLLTDKKEIEIEKENKQEWNIE